MQQSAVEKFCDGVRLIQLEYIEMPGLHLSKRQAQRLWNLDARSTDMIFDALEASNFLRRMPNDMYIRAERQLFVTGQTMKPGGRATILRRFARLADVLGRQR